MAAMMPRMGGGVDMASQDDPAQMIGILKQQIEVMGGAAKKIMIILGTVAPELKSYLVPIAQAGKALQGEVEVMEQKMSGQGSAAPPAAAPNPAGGADEMAA